MIRQMLLTCVAVILCLCSPIRGTPQQEGKGAIWAAVGINDLLFREGFTDSLQIFFTLVNDGNKTVDPQLLSTRIMVNGRELEDSAFILGNGPCGPNCESLPPGETVGRTLAIGRYFQKPGIYKVSFESPSFKTPTIMFRVLAVRK